MMYGHRTKWVSPSSQRWDSQKSCNLTGQQTGSGVPDHTASYKNEGGWEEGNRVVECFIEGLQGCSEADKPEGGLRFLLPESG